MEASRLPGKPLADIHGKPMIVHVWERAMAAETGRVVVATDSDEIAEAIRASGGEAQMTRSDHVSGSDRAFEAISRVDPDQDAPRRRGHSFRKITYRRHGTAGPNLNNDQAPVFKSNPMKPFVQNVLLLPAPLGTPGPVPEHQDIGPRKGAASWTEGKLSTSTKPEAWAAFIEA